MKKFLALLLAAAMLLGCVSIASAGAADNSITICNSSKIPDMNPVNWYISTQSAVFDYVYSTLIKVVVDDDKNVTCRGDLATSWETENDGTVWVFHLNENAVFTDGTPVTADMVKRCFTYHQTNPWTMSYVSMIDSIDVRDDHTVAFNLTGAWASAPYCWYMVAIFNPDLYDADPTGYASNPVGSGPYELTAVDEATATYTLTLKDNWWGDLKPTIQTVNIKTITDVSTMVIALQTGEIDYISSIQGINISLVAYDSNLLMKENTSLVGYQLMMSANCETLQNEAVRQAIAYAIDYDAIGNVISGGYLASKSSSVRFATLDAEIPESVQAMAYSYDPEKAKQLLADAGIETPYTIGTIIGGNSNGAAEMVMQYLSAVGLVCEIEQIETNTMVQRFMSGDFALGITTYPGYVSAAETIMCCYGSGQTYNFYQYKNDRVDELAAEMMATQDPAVYAADLEEALTIIVKDAPTVGLGISASYSVGNKALTFTPSWAGLDLYVAHW